VEIRTLGTLVDQEYARVLFDEIWPTEAGTQLPPNLLQALVHSGAYLSGAFYQNRCIGGAFGFPARGEDGHLHIHSHMAGVLTQYRNLNIGMQLKFHQRKWAIENGYDLITWTFDPLVARNANLNLTKLGVEVKDYFIDFYGTMNDSVNSGDATDRVMAYWWINSEKCHQALESGRNAESSAPISLSEKDNVPVITELEVSELNEIQVALPEDIVELRLTDLDLARRWRKAVRDALYPKMSSGWSITGFTKERTYILERSNHENS
jgi:predicted GNAT superfamily acetyltransferase